MRTQVIGKVMGLAVRTPKNGPMKEVREAVAIAGAGIEGDLPSSPDRGISLLSSVQWETVMQQLGADLPWHVRRANVLVDTPELGSLIGKTIEVGSVQIQVMGETEPCALMDRQFQGLSRALTPHCRGGVHGQVLTDGQFKLGDAVVICD